ASLENGCSSNNVEDISDAAFAPWSQFTSRTLGSTDQIKSLVDSARRSGARGLFRFANWLLRHSIDLYEGSMIALVVLLPALAAVRMLERSERILLFGYRSHRGREDLNRNDRR